MEIILKQVKEIIGKPVIVNKKGPLGIDLLISTGVIADGDIEGLDEPVIRCRTLSNPVMPNGDVTKDDFYFIKFDPEKIEKLKPSGMYQHITFQKDGFETFGYPDKDKPKVNVYLLGRCM